MAQWRMMRANVSPEAGQILNDWFAHHGVTLAAYLEAFAEAVAGGRQPESEDVLRRAREIAYARGRRKR